MRCARHPFHRLRKRAPQHTTGHMVESAEAAVYQLTEGDEVVGVLVSSEAA